MDILALIITALISSIIGGLVAQSREWITGQSKEKKEQREREQEDRQTKTRAARELLKGELIELHDRFVLNGEPITLAWREHAEKIGDLYHSLGGNGTGTILLNEILEVPISSSKGKEEK